MTENLALGLCYAIWIPITAWICVIQYFCLIEWKGKIYLWARIVIYVLLLLLLDMFQYQQTVMLALEGRISLVLLPFFVMGVIGSFFCYAAQKFNEMKI